MQSLKRRRAMLRWCCRIAAVLAVGLAGLFVSTLVWRFRFNPTPRVTIRAYDGLIGFMAVDESRALPLGFYLEREQRPHLKLEAKSLSGPGARGGVTSMVFPIGAVTLVWAPLWWREKTAQRRALKGHCPRCGYDLQGLRTDKCPECGAVQPPTALPN